MKKFILGIILFFLLTINVDAEVIQTYDLEKGNVYSNKQILNSSFNPYDSLGADLIHVIYEDKKGNLLEAFTSTAGAEFTNAYRENSLYEYPEEMYLNKIPEFNFGHVCHEIYSKFSQEHVEWCDKYLTMYSSGKDISNINYWQVESFEEIRLSEFCAIIPEIENSFSCIEGMDREKVKVAWESNRELITYDSFPVIILKEYDPAEFTLECSPKEVKKGETSNCQLKINSEEAITQITINKDLSNEPFILKEITPTEGWEIIENKTGVITLINNNGFEGEGTVFNTIIQFKEDFVNTANIELNNIDYMTINGYELKGTAKDNIKVYEEEIKNPETSNPFIGVLCLLGIIIFTNVFIHYKNRKNQGSELI